MLGFILGIVGTVIIGLLRLLPPQLSRQRRKKKMKAETCECCGRDLPEGEICTFCGHDNHKLKLSGYACKRIRREIKEERKEGVPE